MSSSDLNYWRRFFKTTRHDIFETIESAIHVAATDYPEEFKDKQEYLKQTISTVLSSNLRQCIPSEDTYNTKPKRRNRRKEKIIDEIFNKAKMNFVENWSSDDGGGGGGGGGGDDDDDDNACISDWMKKKSEKKQRKRKGKRVVKDIKGAKRCDRRAKEPTFSSLLPSFPTFSSFTNDPFFSSFPTFSSFTKEPTFSSGRTKDAHPETGSSSMEHMPNTFGTSNDGSATNLVAKEVTVVAEVAKEPTFNSFTKDPIFSSFPTFSSFTKEPTFSSGRAKDAHPDQTGSSSMEHMPNTFGTSNDGSATNLVAKEVAAAVVAEVAKEPTFSSFTKDPIFSSFPTFSSFTKDPTFSSGRAKDAHPETGSSSMEHMPNTFGTSNDGSATNLVAKEVTVVAEVAKEPTFSSFTKDPIFSSFPTFSSFTKDPTFSSWGAKDVHTETGSSSMGHIPNTFGTSNDGSATNLVAKEVAVEVGVGVGVEVERDTLTKKSDLIQDVSKIRDALMKLKGQPVIAYDLLMRLDKMDISAHVLKETEIATIVSSYAKDGYFSDSSQTRLLASCLLESWSIILDKWLDNSNRVRDNEKVTVATEIVEPKSVIEATRTGSLQFHEGPSKPQSSRPIFDIRSRGSTNARCMVASQPAERYKNRQLTSSSHVQIGSSSRANNYILDNEKVTVATEIVEPKSVIEATRTGSLQFHEGPSKPQSSRPIFDIGSRGSTNARCMVAGQPAERYKNRQLTSSSQVQIGSSSRANNNTFLKSQPRYGLHQGPYKLTIKENPNAKNKMEVPAPTKKIEEVNQVRESLEIARRKFQERFQKSEQDARCMVTCQPAERHHFKNRQLTVSSQVQIGGSSKAYGNTSFKSQPRYGVQGPKLSTVKECLDDAKNKLKGPAPAEKIKEDPIRESLELAKRKLQERLQKSEQVKRHNTGLQNADKDTPIGELLSRYRRGPC